jgi:hypothetical protein
MADCGHSSPNQNKTIYLYLCSISSYPKFHLNPNCCSSFVSAVIEGVLDFYSLAFAVRSMKIGQTDSFNRSDWSATASAHLQHA